MVSVDLVYSYFPELSSKQKTQFAALYDIFLEWNLQINVISRKDFENFYERHVLHSLAIAKHLEFVNSDSIIDVGTGGGFPGIPLAILFPETKFTLCDSIGKKIKVVNEVAEHIGITNVRGIHSRSEDLSDKFDALVSRAVTRFSPFMQMTKHLLKKDHKGIYYLKGGDLNQEISELKDDYPKSQIKLHSISTYFREPFFDTKFVVEVTNG